MGLSANQAKLLSITARLSDNELRAQFITNTKMRNADAQSEATGEYMRALDSHDLNYSFYDADNLRTTMKLTPQAMLAFGENKVQYGLVNNAGQLLATAALSFAAPPAKGRTTTPASLRQQTVSASAWRRFPAGRNWKL